MTNQGTDCDHAWQPLSDEALATFRSQTRAGRPPGAWLEKAFACDRCGAIEAEVSWWGQVHRVPVTQREGAALAVQWAHRGEASGPGAMGMGTA